MDLGRKFEGLKQMATGAYVVRRDIKKYAAGEVEEKDLIHLEDNGMEVLSLPAAPTSVDMWGVILTGLIEKYGPSVVRPMRNQYKKVGHEHGKLTNMVLDDEEKPYLVYLWVNFGYVDLAKAQVGNEEEKREIGFTDVPKDVKADDDFIILHAEDSVESRGIEKVGGDLDYGVCIFEPAYGLGIYEKWFDREVELKEVTCQAKGDDYCTWVYCFDGADIPEDLNPPEKDPKKERNIKSREKEEEDFKAEIKRYFETDEDIDDFWSFNQEESEVRFLGLQTLPIGHSGFATMAMGLINDLGPSSVRAMRESYETVGKQYAGYIEDDVKEENLGELFEIFGRFGYYDILNVMIENNSGKRPVETSEVVEEYLPSDDKIIFEVKNSATANGMVELMEDTDYPSCVFEPAFIQGALSEWISEDFIVEEVECETVGDSKCVWEFEKKN